MKPDEIEKRLKNALIYGTSHPEAYKTKADELWEKYSTMHRGLQYMDEPQFLAALHEYGEAVKAERFKRQWVGLTDEEVEALLDEMSLGCCGRDVKVVEAKLKEKNGW